MERQQLDRVFSALSDPTRREILRIIQDNQLAIRVTDLAKPFNMTLPAVTKHLKVLEQAQLIKKEKKGREIRIQLNALSLKEVTRYLSFYRQFWNREFNAVQELLRRRKLPKLR